MAFQLQQKDFDIATALGGNDITLGNNLILLGYSSIDSLSIVLTVSSDILFSLAIYFKLKL